MRSILFLAFKSMFNRRFTVLLTLLSIALSVALLLGVERIRSESKNSFANTISGTDLIVGARSSKVQLLLYSVFRMGDATNNISWQSYQELASRPNVSWTIPISLGDSHRGYRVMGTNQDYFKHFRYGSDQALKLDSGKVFDDLYHAVIGAEVAGKLGYKVGDKIVLSHGAGDVSFMDHGDKPFVVAGILAATGTPVDRTVHVSLQGIEAIHIGWESGSPAGMKVPAQMVRKLKLQPKQITAFMVKLKSPMGIFKMQREVNQYKEEPLSAILPGVALQELWGLIGIAEKSLMVVSGFVVLVGIVGLLTSLLTSLNERRREMAIYRSVGAKPSHIFSLIVGEALALTCGGVVVGVGLLYLVLSIGQPILLEQFGLYIKIGLPSAYEFGLLATVVVAGFLAGFIPGLKSYYYSLSDGMTIRT